MFSVKQRLLEAYQAAKVIPFDASSKFIILSDCHRGQGNSADNFLPNQEVYCGALEYYLANGYTYIEPVSYTHLIGRNGRPGLFQQHRHRLHGEISQHRLGHPLGGPLDEIVLLRLHHRQHPLGYLGVVDGVVQVIRRTGPCLLYTSRSPPCPYFVTHQTRSA